jgi:hypothetical protein
MKNSMHTSSVLKNSRRYSERKRLKTICHGKIYFLTNPGLFKDFQYLLWIVATFKNLMDCEWLRIQYRLWFFASENKTNNYAKSYQSCALWIKTHFPIMMLSFHPADCKLGLHKLNYLKHTSLVAFHLYSSYQYYTTVALNDNKDNYDTIWSVVLTWFLALSLYSNTCQQKKCISYVSDDCNKSSTASLTLWQIRELDFLQAFIYI